MLITETEFCEMHSILNIPNGILITDPNDNTSFVPGVEWDEESFNFRMIGRVNTVQVTTKAMPPHWQK